MKIIDFDMYLADAWVFGFNMYYPSTYVYSSWTETASVTDTDNGIVTVSLDNDESDLTALSTTFLDPELAGYEAVTVTDSG